MELIKRILPVAALIGAVCLIILTDSPEDAARRQAAVREKTETEAEAGDVYPLSRSAFSLDTVCTLTLYAGGGQEALDRAAAELSRYDGLFSWSDPDSDIGRINGRREGRVAVSRETAELLALSQAFGALSGNELDMTVGRLSRLWDVKNRKTVPPEAEIQAALSACDPQGFWLEREGQQDYFCTEDPELQIDVGAVAKGYIADRLKESLLEAGVSSAIINLGGNVLCLGELPEGEPFRIGLRKPDKESAEEAAVLSARDISVVTAGIYERYFEENGIHYHHILSTADGYPVQNELAAVTVAGPESFYCDALATTLFIKGTEEGLRFLAEWNETNETGISGEEKGASGASAREAAESGPYYAYFFGKDGSITASRGGGSLLLEEAPGYRILEAGE